MTNKPLWKKAAALLLTMAVLICSLPTLVLQAAGEVYSRAVDAPSLDGWKSLFGKDVASTEHAGTVWTDKSVFTDAAAFDGTGVALPEDGDNFLVALSAMASSVSVNGVANDAVTGELSFTDAIGNGMKIRGIQGILIGNTLFSGATLSRNFVPGGGDLGSYEQSTALGDELVRAIRARLGVDGDTARDLIGLAYREGQLGYNDDTDFSNYIGWYANAAGKFLGFWYENIQTMPDPADPALTDATRPAFIVRSYFYMGQEQDDAQSAMMYLSVQVRERLDNGTQEMSLRVPAALIPTVTYAIETDADGQLTSFSVAGAEHPIRLVYEVALREGMDAVSVHSYIESGVITPQADGAVLFHTARTAESCFTPSLQNPQYYFMRDSVLYTDVNGTLYKGDKPSQAVYSALKVYTDEGLVTVYERVSPSAAECAVRCKDGSWYIPAGTPRQIAEISTALTNNGTLTMIPETGIVLHCFADQADSKEHFRYTLNRTDKAETATYKAFLYKGDGTVSEQRVLFEDGVAQVTLSPDETLAVYGMTAGGFYTITQRPHEQYKLVAVNGDALRTQAELTTTTRRVVHASFDNAKKGYGSVTIVKRILHDFGASYEIPDKQFAVRVTLSEEYANSTMQVDHSGDPAVTTVATDENASFTVMLGHADQLELLRLREGTVVTATELDIPDGFVPIYYGAGIKDASSVTVQANTAVSILILNRYTYEQVDEIPITVNGTVSLNGRENGEWLDTDVFTVELQRYETDGWVTVASEEATKSASRFDFTAAMQAERFAQSGVYSYQVIERIGDLAGIAYDHTVHTFSVTVGDEGMCGYLHILDVTSHHDHTHVGGGEQNGWHIRADFTNVYYAGGHAEAVVDIRTELFNPSESDRVSLADYRFALFDNDSAPVFVSDYTDMVGEARLVASFDKSGEYVYTLRQLIPQTPAVGMVYSDKEYVVTITVTEDAVGALSAHINITLNNETVAVPQFTNRYTPQTAVLLPDVKTELAGRDLRDGEFTVQIKEGDTLLVEGVNDEHGDIVFGSALEFTVVGDYYYDVTEVHGTLGGVSYDPIVYRLHIDVSDNGEGALAAHYHVINTAVDVITFRNLYEASAVDVVVDGVKQLIGRELINEEFTFVLVEADNPHGMILSASNYADGTFRFTPITLCEDGTYRYTVHEVFESVAHGIVFDDTVYEVTVTVTDDGCGALQAQTRLYKNGEATERIIFVNQYVTTPAEVVLSGTVYADGRVPADGEFSIELYEADENWCDVKRVATVQNDSNGNFSFETLRFDTQGTYRFVVRQDDEEYRVLVDVTDNRRGNVFARVTLFRADGTVAEELFFEHTTLPDVPAATTTAVAATTTTAARKDNPKTGDVADLALWFALLFISGGVSMTLALRGKKEYGE